MSSEPSYRKNDTYSGWTQDLIRLIHEAHKRGAERVDIRHESWHVTVEWPRDEES